MIEILRKGGRAEVFSVSYDKEIGKWRVLREGKPFKIERTKRSAIKKAKRTAKSRNRDSVVAVFRKDGSRQEQFKYPKKGSKSDKTDSYIGRKRNEFF